MLYRVIIPLLTMVFDVLQFVLTYKIFKYSHFPEVIVMLYIPIAALFVFQLIFLIRRKFTIKTHEMLFGVIFALAHRIRFTEPLKMGYGFSPPFLFFLQILIMINVTIVSEILTGRKARMERNTILVITTACISGVFCFKEDVPIIPLVTYSLVYYIVTSSHAIFRYIIYSTGDCVNIIFISSLFFLFTVFIDTFLLKNKELATMNHDILHNPINAACMTFSLLGYYCLDFLVLRNFDIDVYFMIKLGKLIVITLVTQFDIL